MKSIKNTVQLRVFFLLTAILSAAGIASAQTGFINPNVDYTVYDLTLQPDGKILIAGDFNNVGGQPRSKVARLNADGSLDTSFQNPQIVGEGSNDDVFTIARQSDGKVLIGGIFTSVGGQFRNYLARLNADGSLDTTFTTQVSSSVTKITVQADGKILIGGYFTAVNGQTRQRLARLNADGSLDASFLDPNVNNWISTIVQQADGKILVGGYFTTVGGQSRNFGTRINADGSLDTSFNFTVSGPLANFAIQSDGKILVCGYFQNINGAARSAMGRINADGSLDSSFQNLAIPSGNITTISIQTDGRIVVGGDFATIAGNARNDLARLNSDGTFDASFRDPNENFGGTFSSINEVLVQPDGKVLIGGQFDTISHQPRKNVVRLNADGTLDQPPAQTLTVTKISDTNDGSCTASDCSLREAVAAANAIAEPSLINFDPQIFGTQQTIILALGEIVLEDNHQIFINGPGTNLVTISGGNTSRLFRIKRDVRFNVRGVSLTNGNGGGGGFSGDGGAIYIEPNGITTELNLNGVVLSGNRALSGGAIRSVGTSKVTILNSTITGNTATYNLGGGGIYFDAGTLDITGSTLSNNVADFQNGGGGAISFSSGSSVFNLTDSVVTNNFASNVGGLGTAATTTISNCTITNNRALNFTGGIGNNGVTSIINSTVKNNTVDSPDGRGGGISNYGRLTVTNSTIENNSAAFGAGIFTAGGLNFNESSVINNTSSKDGGGIYNNAGGTTTLPVSVTNAVIRGNVSRSFGGGIYSRDTFNLSGSTVSQNSSDFGGGGLFNVYLNGVGTGEFSSVNSTFEQNTSNSAGGGIANQTGVVRLTNSTVSGNTARGFGGALNTNSNGVIHLMHSTIAFNTSVLTTSGGVSNSGGTVNSQNSILARNFSSGRADFGDFVGTLNSQGHNIIEKTEGAVINGTTTGNQLNVDPLLVALADNGGRTRTHALRLNSTAVDAASTVANLTTDQRGTTRPFDFTTIPNAPGGNGSDIGAFELQSADRNTFSTRFDFDGDGKSDVSIYRPSTGAWWISRSAGSTVAVAFGTSTDKIVPADYTGDGKTDLAVFRESSGQWFVLRSEDSTFYGFPFGASGDKAVPADFDGDGKADPSVFRPSNGGWYSLVSSTGSVLSRAFGAAEDVPLPNDYDGDGKADVAIFRPSTSAWWTTRSSNNSTLAVQFGQSGDRPVPADYTGDGKADFAFFRPSNGTWYVMRSEDFSFYGFPFGAGTDTPAVGDYDGDGKADAAVFRESNSGWYLQRSSQGFIALTFGTAGDKPVPAAYLP